MESVSKMADPESPGQSNTTRREFLKTSLATSVAAATVGAAAMGEGAAATPESKAERPSILTVTNTGPFAPLRRPWKNAIAVDVPLMLLRENLQSYLAILQRDIGYRYCRTFGFLQDEMAIVTRRKDEKPGVPLGAGGQGSRCVAAAPFAPFYQPIPHAGCAGFRNKNRL